MNETWQAPEGWGNPKLTEFQEIPLPESVSWFPATSAWWWVVGAVILFLAYRCFRVFERWQRNRYRREAIEWLRGGIDGDERLQQLPVVLKATAMRAYGRERVASLGGEAWLEFLRRTGQQDGFSKRVGAALLEADYADPEQWSGVRENGDALIAAAQSWIKHHVVSSDDPKRQAENLQLELAVSAVSNRQ